MSISKSGLKVDGLPIFFFLQGGFLYDSVLDNFVYVIKILAVSNDNSIGKCSIYGSTYCVGNLWYLSKGGFP